MFFPAIALVFVLLGSLAGFLAGLLGIGGGIIFIPLFLWSFPLVGYAPEVIVHAAFGTSLAIIIPTAVSSTLAHRQRGNVDWHHVYRLAAGAVAGAVGGGLLAAHIPGGYLKGLFGAMQILVGLHLFFRPRHLPPERESTVLLWQLLSVGFATGAFSAFFGVGGGVIGVPLMVILLRLPTHLAVGNSSAVIAISTVFGAVSYVVHGWGMPGLAPFSLGYVNLLVALIVAPCAIYFARLGARVASRTDDARLLRVFSVVLMLIGLRILSGFFL